MLIGLAVLASSPSKLRFVLLNAGRSFRTGGRAKSGDRIVPVMTVKAKIEDFPIRGAHRHHRDPSQLVGA